MRQKRFTEEFRQEAVRLALTSGRRQTEIARDLGVGQSTLERWIGAERDRAGALVIEGEAPEQELKRLRRENFILQQERDILNWSRNRNRSSGAISRRNAAVFFAQEGSR